MTFSVPSPFGFRRLLDLEHWGLGHFWTFTDIFRAFQTFCAFFRPFRHFSDIFQTFSLGHFQTFSGHFSDIFRHFADVLGGTQHWCYSGLGFLDSMSEQGPKNVQKFRNHV